MGTLLCAKAGHSVAPNPHSTPIVAPLTEILLTVQGRTRFLGRKGGIWNLTMIETVSALMGLVSAGIFLAHAFEGYRTRA
ncbi:hypothetical protein NLM27_13700 [Bradyrhizobium sp. CCGB12]|nr:hypothetical protein [Bradyrhizobium sp. CCGB12]MCP3389828.1 hypothetical protein [Bradyrhizobium sp. CCGB12]